ncbi:hypothetical protein KQI52_11475 [bacterium]|nr:hypothetical protein [bacterium]
MALRTRTFQLTTSLILALLLLTSLSTRAVADDRSVTTNLGRITLPESWSVEQVSDDHITAWSEEDGSRLDLYQRPFERLTEYLHKRADELRISRYVRSVSQDFLEEVNADKGGFILGLNPLAAEDAPVVPVDKWEDLDLENLSGVPSNYLYVVAYERDRELYVLEVTASTVSGDELLLADLHRSWRLP